MVLRQCACLVGEDILNLAEVLADVESSTLERRVRGGVVHVPIPVDEVDLDEFDYLNGNVQRDWDDDLGVWEIEDRDYHKQIYLKDEDSQ